MIILPEVISILKKYFEFDRTYDLLDYDKNFDRLRQDLTKQVKPHYNNNYRFIFLHYDTDYFINHNVPSLTLINLQRTLASLDISNYFCLILTQQDLTEQLEFLKNTETTDTVPIASMKVLLHKPLYHALDGTAFDKDLPLAPNNIHKKFIALNGVGRFHRRLVVGGLQQYNVVNDGIVSYNLKS